MVLIVYSIILGQISIPYLNKLSKLEIEVDRAPRPLMCLTEHFALSMAHGYAMKKGKAQAVMVHVGLGTMELGGALHNISKGREPALIIAGRFSYSFEGELRRRKGSSVSLGPRTV